MKKKKNKFQTNKQNLIEIKNKTKYDLPCEYKTAYSALSFRNARIGISIPLFVFKNLKFFLSTTSEVGGGKKQNLST